MTPEQFATAIDEDGWVIFPNWIPDLLLQTMRCEIHNAYDRCREIQVKNGVAGTTAYTVHHLPGQHPCWVECLACMPHQYIEQYFGGKYILNSMGGAIMLNTEKNKSYAQGIHRDIRTHHDERLMLNTLVMLDDFTADNGATWLASGTQWMPEKPTEDVFRSVAQQAIAPAGSILMFDSNLWHSGGVNKTSEPRRSVTPLYSVPWYRQEFDYCRAVENIEGYHPDMQQVLGYFRRVPSTLAEFYQPPDNRMYRPSQG